MTTISDAQQALGDAALEVAQLFAIGGAVWSVTRSTGGDGISSDGSTATHSITAYVRRIAPSRLAVALAGGQAVKDSWQLVAAPGVDLRADDTIESAADPLLRFKVKPRGASTGATRAALEPLA